MTLRIAKMRYRCRDAATSLRDRGAPRAVRPETKPMRKGLMSGMHSSTAEERWIKLRCRDAATSLQDRGAPRAVRPAREVNRVLKSGIPGSAAETQPPACGTGAHHEPSDL